MNQNEPERLAAAGLVFFERQEKPRQYVIFDRADIRGQCPTEVFTTSALLLEYSFLAEDQGVIFSENGRWYYQNHTDDGYTFVSGKNLRSGERAELLDGSVIRLVNDRMLTAVFFDHFVSGRDWRFLNMDDGRHIVNITQKKEGEEEKVSLSFIFEDGRWTMEEYLAEEVLHNGIPVEDRAVIRIDDSIQIGGTRFVFEGSGLVYGYPIQDSDLTIRIDERSVHRALKKVKLLEDINLSIDPGDMVLILGGSGAGKSTFVNAVTGYEKADAMIREGDLDYYRDYDKVKYRIGFVPQDNLMRMEDTVGSTLSNAADMRLPRDMRQEEKQRRIAAVLETFGLSGKEKEQVSKLSGGQKKRLSICMEFIASPSLFILDEPDSGLDGIMATELMENLRLIACQGRIVMVITHTPDRVAHLFDKVIVLAKSSVTEAAGLAFYGGVQEARDFFGVRTMEDVVRRVNSVKEGGEGRADEYIDRYREYAASRPGEDDTTYEEVREEEPADTRSLPQPERDPSAEEVVYRSRAEQIPVYLGKQFRLMLGERNWKVLPMAGVIAWLVVFVLGRSMFRSMEFTKYGSLAVICVCIWNGMFNSIQAVCKERDIIKREHRAGLHISAYLTAHMLYQAVICAAQVTITLQIFRVFGMYYPETGLITGSFALDLAVTMFLVTYASDMLALMVSCLSHTTTTAMTIMPFLLVVQLVFAGGIFPLQGYWTQTISRYTISSWGIRAVNIAADYNSQPSVALTMAIDAMEDPEDDLMVKIHNVLEIDELSDRLQEWSALKLQDKNYAYKPENLLGCWRTLFLFSAAYILIGLIALEQIDRDSR